LTSRCSDRLTVGHYRANNSYKLLLWHLSLCALIYTEVLTTDINSIHPISLHYRAYIHVAIGPHPFFQSLKFFARSHSKSITNVQFTLYPHLHTVDYTMLINIHSTAAQHITNMTKIKVKLVPNGITQP